MPTLRPFTRPADAPGHEDRLRSTVSALREQPIDRDLRVGVQAPADDDRMVA